MVEFTKASLIWNRACFGEATSPLAGDRALMAVLVFHGAAMNGGVLDAIESIEPQALAAAQAGYRFFGFDHVADLLGEATSLSTSGIDLDLLEAELDKRYSALVPGDSALIERFKASLHRNPEEFAPS